MQNEERKRDRAKEHDYGGCPECGDTDGMFNIIEFAHLLGPNRFKPIQLRRLHGMNEETLDQLRIVKDNVADLLQGETDRDTNLINADVIGNYLDEYLLPIVGPGRRVTKLSDDRLRALMDDGSDGVAGEAFFEYRRRNVERDRTPFNPFKPTRENNTKVDLRLGADCEVPGESQEVRV